MSEYLSLLMFLLTGLAILLGFPVAFTLGGVALICAWLGDLLGVFEMTLLNALPSRIFGIISNQTLVAVPLFVLMGVMLEKSKVAESLLESMSRLFGKSRAGLGVCVTLIGMLLAASTGIVGATVVTMGVLSLPVMLKRGYPATLATGAICATGTLGQIIPPSIVLVLLGDVLSNAYQQAQLNMGIFTPKTVSVGDLFVGALIPGLLLVLFYILYIIGYAWLQPWQADTSGQTEKTGQPLGQTLTEIFTATGPPLTLILLVLGSILGGYATPTEAAGVGALGATLIAWSKGRLTRTALTEVTQSTANITSMVFMILIGASLFSLVFRGLGGEELVHALLTQLPGGVATATLAVMVLIFLLGFMLDFIEITFVVVPIVGPVLLMMGLDPIWLGVMIAVNLQTSFLTPPFGFALFYLRGVTPANITTESIYRGVIPFIVMQVLLMLILACYPQLITWLPDQIYPQP